MAGTTANGKVNQVMSRNVKQSKSVLNDEQLLFLCSMFIDLRLFTEVSVYVIGRHTSSRILADYVMDD